MPAALAEADADLRHRLERDLVVGFLEELERRVRMFFETRPRPA